MKYDRLINEEIYDNPKSWNMTNDLIFKALFGRDTEVSKRLLIDLINTVLQLEGENQIIKVAHLNPFNYQVYMSDKLTILDIKAETDKGTYVNVEMQVGREAHYFERALYYWSELFADQIDDGNEYSTLQKTIGIHFIDYSLVEKEFDAHGIFKLHDITSHVLATDLLELHFVQLPRIHDIIDLGEQKLADWIKLMKDINNPEMQEEIENIARQKEVMKVAAEEYMRVTADQMLRAQLRSKEKFKRDQLSQMNTAKREGLQQGIEEGREIGIEQGREIGIEQGVEQGVEQSKKIIAKRLLNKGMSINEVAEMTGLTVTVVESLLI